MEVFNLRITVTTYSNLSLKKFRQNVCRIMRIQENIWVLNLCLIYHRIYGQKLASGFPKARLYFITVAVVRRCSVKKVFLEITQNLQKNTCARVFFFYKAAGLKPEACNFIKEETLAFVFSCEFCNISKNTFSCRAPLEAASVISQIDWRKLEAPYEMSSQSWVLMAKLLK